MKKARKAQGRLDSANVKGSNETHRSGSGLPPMIYEQAPVGIVESTLQGECIDANEEFCRMVGYEKEQLLGRGIKDILFEKDYPVVMNLYHQLVEGKIPFYTLEKRYVRKDGEIVWVEAKRSLVRTSDGQALYTIGAMLDVTERKQAEEKYQRIVKTANEGIWEIDKEVRTVFVNSRMADMLGYTVEEMMGRSVFEFIFPEDYAEGEHRLERAKQDVPTRSDEFRYRRKDGSELWVIVSTTPKLDPQGNFLGSFAMFSDITELKKAEDALRELNLELENRVQQQTAELQAANQVLLEQLSERKQAEELLRSWAHIFEHADWGIATVLDDTFVMVNPMFAKMHGYAVNELIGRSIYDVLAPESLADTHEQIRISYETGHHVYENKHIRKDGSIFLAWVDTSIVKDSDNNVLYRAISLQDITERKRAEEALEQNRQYLKVLSRRLVEVQDEERRAIARELHDRVGQNLSALKINLTMMENLSLQDRMQQNGTRIQDSLKILEETIKLVRGLLIELRPAELDAYGLKAALESYIDEFTPRYGINIVLNIENESFPRLNPSLEITVLRIAQEALTNVARYAQADQAMLSLRLENNTIYLTVLDNGIGIEASRGQTPHIGHGLKIMRERAEAFGGTVTVGMAEGKGTKVEASIPLAGAGITS